MSAFFSSTLPVVLRAQRPDLGVHGPLTRHCFYGSSIHVSRKGWHMLLNLCFHMAMTSAVFAGGITLTNYQMVCQAVSRGRAGVSRMGASSLGTEEGGTQAKRPPPLSAACRPRWPGPPAWSGRTAHPAPLGVCSTVPLVNTGHVSVAGAS